MKIRSGAFAAVFAIVVLCRTGLAQSKPDEQRSVRISGRLVFPPWGPEGNKQVFLDRIEPDDATEHEVVVTDSHGLFTFKGTASNKYRIWLGPRYGTSPIVVDTSSGRDIDVGDLIFKQCSSVGDYSLPKAPNSQPSLVGDLKLEQIIVESSEPFSGALGGFVAPSLPKRSAKLMEALQCWSGLASLDKREVWEGLCGVQFDRFVSIESFVGGKVKSIRVIHYLPYPKLTPVEIKEEVRKVWLGTFSNAACDIGWAEGNAWNIEASVEYEDGKRSSLLMDNWMHVRVQDREGKYWYIRRYLQ